MNGWLKENLATLLRYGVVALVGAVISNVVRVSLVEREQSHMIEKIDEVKQMVQQAPWLK